MKRIHHLAFSLLLFFATLTPTAYSMTLEGAVIREQGVTFAVIVDQPYAVRNSYEGNKVINAAEGIFGVPVVLVAIEHGKPIYFGRTDIVDFMAKVEISRIQWKTFTIH